MTEKESFKNHFLFKIISVLVQGPLCNETETSQGAKQKSPENDSNWKAHFARIRFPKTVRLIKNERLTGGSHPSGLKI